MTLLGCREVKPDRLPRPVLAEPSPAGDLAKPQVSLNWFCPTAGVHRFQIKIARADRAGGMPPEPTGITSSKLKALPSSFADARTRYMGLLSLQVAKVRFDETQLTPPIGPDFGPGPQFTLTAEVLPNVPYLISVAPLDRQDKGGDASQSQVWPFTWKPPVTLAEVPWPARPLPPVSRFHEEGLGVPGSIASPFAARILTPNFAIDKRWPVGIVIGTVNPQMSSRLGSNAGTTNLLAYTVSFGQPQAPYFELLTRRSPDPSKKGEPLLPIVVYRQQVTNAAFPRVSGHLAQVSPLLEHIPTSIEFGDSGSLITIRDRLIASGYTPFGLDNYGNFIFLRDQQPVIRGARYRYLVVRLNNKAEVSEIIDAGVVDIPTDL
jgi:hypothetical protein